MKRKRGKKGKTGRRGGGRGGGLLPLGICELLRIPRRGENSDFCQEMRDERRGEKGSKSMKMGEGL